MHLTTSLYILERSICTYLKWLLEPVQHMMNQCVKTNTRIHWVSVCLRSRNTEYAIIKISLCFMMITPKWISDLHMSWVLWSGLEVGSWATDNGMKTCVCLYTIGSKSLRTVIETLLCCFNDSVHLNLHWCQSVSSKNKYFKFFWYRRLKNKTWYNHLAWLYI